MYHPNTMNVVICVTIDGWRWICRKKNSNFTKTKRTHTHKDKRTRLKYKNETNDNKPGNPQLVNFH